MTKLHCKQVETARLALVSADASTPHVFLYLYDEDNGWCTVVIGNDGNDNAAVLCVGDAGRAEKYMADHITSARSIRDCNYEGKFRTKKTPEA